jgi:hypothetical protein
MMSEAFLNDRVETIQRLEYLNSRSRHGPD